MPDLEIRYDAECPLCSGFVTFLRKRDLEKRFNYTPLQKSPSDGPACFETLVVVKQGKRIERSDAVLAVAGQLGLPWSLLRMGNMVPRKFRDGLYNWVARNRYRWFGKKSCGG